MTNRHAYEKPTTYLIRVRGNLDSSWSDWFNGFTITGMEGETILEGTVPDQAALHGVLTKINDLGLALISVNQQSR
jgi:hypothetical protein